MQERQFVDVDARKEISKWISGLMLEDGSTIVGKILGVSKELVGRDVKSVLWLDSTDKGWPLNTTNFKTLITALGGRTGAWAGAEVEIFGTPGMGPKGPCTQAKVRVLSKPSA